MKKPFVFVLMILCAIPSISSMESGLSFQEKSIEGEELPMDEKASMNVSAVSDQGTNAEDQQNKKQKTEQPHKRNSSSGGICEGCKELNLCCMPDEIKLHIAQFMDCNSFLNMYSIKYLLALRLDLLPTHVHHDTRRIAYTLQPHARPNPVTNMPHATSFYYRYFSAENNGQPAHIEFAGSMLPSHRLPISSATDCPCTNPCLLGGNPTMIVQQHILQYMATDTACYFGRPFPAPGESPRLVYTAPCKVTGLTYGTFNKKVVLALGLKSGEIVFFGSDLIPTKIDAPSHASPIRFLQQDRKSSKLIAQHENGHIYLRDTTAELKLLGTLHVSNSLYRAEFPIDRRGLKSVLFTLDSSTGQNNLTMWDLETLQVTEHTLDDDCSPIHAIACYKDMLALGYDTEIIFRDLNNNFKEIGHIPTPHNYVLDFWKTPDKPLLITHTPSPIILDFDLALMLQRTLLKPSDRYSIDQVIYHKSLYEKMIATILAIQSTQKDKLVLHSNMSKILYNRLPDFVKSHLAQSIVKTKKGQLF